MRSARSACASSCAAGRSDIERRTGEEIVSPMSQRCENTIGQDTLLQFLATLERASRSSRPTPDRRTWGPPSAFR